MHTRLAHQNAIARGVKKIRGLFRLRTHAPKAAMIVIITARLGIRACASYIGEILSATASNSHFSLPACLPAFLRARQRLG